MITGRFTLPLAVVSLAMPALCPAVDLFSESFDSEVDSKMEINSATGGLVTFVDYSNMTVDYIQYPAGAVLGDSGDPAVNTLSLPEAPRQIPGSLATRGVLMQCDYSQAATERIVNLVALQSAGGDRLDLTGKNYQFRYDVYLRVSPDVTIAAGGFPNEAGTTEQVLWGVGYNGNLGSPVARGWRSSRGSGMWGWLATEGGHGATAGGDASLWKNTAVVSGWNMGAAADNAATFTPAFGAATLPVPNAPANQWVEATVTVKAKKVTVEYKGANGVTTKFFDNVSALLDEDPNLDAVSGSVMIGYEDSFNSISFAPGDQWALIDNVVVEEISEPTMEVNQIAGLTTYTGGAPGLAAFTVKNNQEAATLTISGLPLSGANPGDFQVLTPVPLTIAPGESSQIEVQFLPLAPNGIKSATLTVSSDDPQTPAYEITDLRARRSVGGFLEAHYKLDDTAGIVVADSSGNGVNGGLQIREPLAYGQPGLLGAGDTGTSMGFLPAQSGTTGNYMTSNVVHTPTFSISMWVRPQETGATRTLFERDPDFDGTYNEICGLRYTTDGSLVYSVRSFQVLVGDLANAEISHVVITHLDEDGFENESATRSRMYINGVRVSEADAASAIGFGDYSLAPTVGALHIGSSTVAGQGFSGEIDDIQIYGVELTPEQVNDMYHRPGVTALDTPPFQITGVVKNPANGGFTVEFPSSPSVFYQLYRSPDLSTWTPVGNPVEGTPASATTLIEDPAAPAGKQYYRVGSVE